MIHPRFNGIIGISPSFAVFADGIGFLKWKSRAHRMYRWQIAEPQEYERICRLFLESELGLGRTYSDIERRISIPLLLKQLITFYRNEVFCGFVTVAFLSEEAETHMRTSGIHALDWRSGDIFWVVDYVAHPKADGYKMLRMVTRDLHVKKARYFRDKFKETREVRVIACPAQA